eukprot:TRINITY_DN51226_c0_g1_i1.p1 TRINITY_DN51226_c0_g1~~TRINITY_DN51226_c0_g1_i1.p1  ORF type:complete len:360 (-),score=45.59 TRINITY_DN51226_c0_g1_i1:193-1272(-)
MSCCCMCALFFFIVSQKPIFNEMVMVGFFFFFFDFFFNPEVFFFFFFFFFFFSHNIEKLNIENLYELFLKCGESESFPIRDTPRKNTKFFDIQKIVCNMSFQSTSSLEQTIKTSSRLIAPKLQNIFQRRKKLQHPNGNSETDSQEDCVIAEEFTQEEQPIHLDLARRELAKNYRVSKLAESPRVSVDLSLPSRERSFTTVNPITRGNKSKPAFVKNLPLQINNEKLRESEQIHPQSAHRYCKEKTFGDNLDEKSDFQCIDSLETETAKNTPVRPCVDEYFKEPQEEQKSPTIKKFKVCLLSRKTHTPQQALHQFFQAAQSQQIIPVQFEGQISLSDESRNCHFQSSLPQQTFYTSCLPK